MAGGGESNSFSQDAAGPRVEIRAAVREGVILEVVPGGLWFQSFSLFSHGIVAGAGCGGGGGRLRQAHGVLRSSGLLRNVQLLAIGEQLGVEGPEARGFLVVGVGTVDDALYFPIEFVCRGYFGLVGNLLSLEVLGRWDPIGDSLLVIVFVIL